MIEEQALVTRIAGPHVYVKGLAGGACGGCAQRQSCGAALTAQCLPVREMALSSDLELKVGDRVVVGIDEMHLLRASLFVYLPPLLFALLAAGLSGGGDTMRAAAAVAGLGAGLYLIHRLQRGFLRLFMAPPRIIKKI